MSRRILLHVCCAPCSIYPFKKLLEQGHSVTGFFFNHNIHPYQEYRKRLDAVRDFAGRKSLEMIYKDEYALEKFLSAVAANPSERCTYCYFSRLDAAAATAAELGFDAFTSSLLYSRYQNHDLIIQTAERAAERHGIAFYYEDFRPGWQEGIKESKEMGLYRQQYCGCIYSEKERYLPKAKNV
jgi:predicted adenine nucleotide alpha hydrolase (AANH) superfamily ATPase